jgi:hypothetical protein
MSNYTKSAHVTVAHDDGRVMEYEVFEQGFSVQDADEPNPVRMTQHFVAARNNPAKPFQKVAISEIDDFDFCIIMDAIGKAEAVDND